MAVWLELIPQLHRAGGADVGMRHHHFHEKGDHYFTGDNCIRIGALYSTRSISLISTRLSINFRGVLLAVLKYAIFASSVQFWFNFSGSWHQRQKPQAPRPQAPIRNRQTRKVANAKGLKRNTNLT